MREAPKRAGQAVSGECRTRKPGRRHATLCGLILVGLVLVPSASATQVIRHSLTSTIDGSGSTAGPFGINNEDLAVDDQTHVVYVLDIAEKAGGGYTGVIDKFDSAGHPEAFTDPALNGSTSLPIPNFIGFGSGPIVVDNSGTATQGRIYLMSRVQDEILAFEPSGAPAAGFAPPPGGFANPLEGIAVDSSGHLWATNFDNEEVEEFTSSGEHTGVSIDTSEQDGHHRSFTGPTQLGFDSAGNAYVLNRVQSSEYFVDKYNAAGEFDYRLSPVQSESLEVDPISGDVYVFSNTTELNEYNSSGIETDSISLPSTFGTGTAIDPVSHELYWSDHRGHVDLFDPLPAITLPEPNSETPTDFEPTSVIMRGNVAPEGVPTNACRFEWGRSTAYGHVVPCAEGNVFSDSGTDAVTAQLTGLAKGHTYHYRLSAANAQGELKGRDVAFSPSAAPAIADQFVDGIHSDSVVVHAAVDPEGASATYHIEYGTTVAYGGVTEPVSVGSDLTTHDESVEVKGLLRGQTYHYRVVAQNQTSVTYGPDRTFTTFPFSALLSDSCSNAHVRQQTGAALLSDCRAYELVSAGNTAGYDVESNLVAGQTPFGGYPQASGTDQVSRVLYGVHNGSIPGSGRPTGDGLDPYLAVRGENEWKTEYVGVPANNPFAGGPFGSPLLEADSALDTLAFGGEQICSPCFSDGSTGVPVHLPGGELVQGMAGLNPQPAAQPAGYIGQHLSADGSHFVFGATAQFEPDGNGNGDVSIYDRDLRQGVTHVVSKTPGGATMTGSGIAELDMSTDGSRILVGRLVSTDTAGNRYWQLYMNIGDSSKTIEVTPGATHGVLFDGMTANGSSVIFTTRDALTEGDKDHSADIYRAEVSPAGSTLTLVSTGTGGAGNTDSCEPTDHWNTTSGEANCDAVAIGGGGGVASQSGAAFFLSPELLDGASNGTQGEPNLYVAAVGAAPRFVATIDSKAGKAPPPATHQAPPTAFAGSGTDALGQPTSVAVDQSSHDVYVTDPSSNRIEKFDSSGTFLLMFGKDVDKTASADVCTSASGHICQSGTPADGAGVPTGAFNIPTFLAVDNSGGSSSGDVYVGDTGSNLVEKFDSSGNLISSWGTGGRLSGFGALAGIAVDPSGSLYVFDTSGTVRKFDPAGNSLESYKTPRATSPSGFAVDSLENGYKVAGTPNVEKFDSLGHDLGEVDGATDASGLAIDPRTEDLYVSQSSGVINRFDSNCPLPDCTPSETFGAGDLNSPEGLAIDATTGAVYVANTGGGNVVVFPPPPLPPSITNPTVVDAVQEGAIRHTADFQTTPSGQTAVFPSSLPLTGYDNAGHTELFRYDSQGGGQLACVSCAPTGARATGDAELAGNGLSLTDDGRVFFSSADALSPRDLDELEDAYEWEPEGSGNCQAESLSFDSATSSCVNLISTGTSPFSSRLLGASADGTDAFFFTRDTLVPQDENGELVKIYDARELGGFPFQPSSPPCAASDECHGASSQAPPPPPIRSVAGHTGNTPAPACKKGFIKRHSRCVKRHSKTRHHHRRRHGKGSSNHHG